MNHSDAIGGPCPLTTQTFANRAAAYVSNPNRNPLKEILDQAESYNETPPLLGIFNDIPWHKFRESEALVWAQAGFSWIVNDGEHSQWEGVYGREQNATIARLGMVPVQRLPREAVSEHGDAFQLGARATMRPYGTTYEDADRYFRAIKFPVPGKATPFDRGGYPVREGDGSLLFAPRQLREAESQIQGWLQFETAEYILDIDLRDKILDLMESQEQNMACGFVGPFDMIMREGELPGVEDAISDLFREASRRRIHMGRVFGSSATKDVKEIEDAMSRAIEDGARLIAVHPLTSDLTYRGAKSVAAPFFNALQRCGF